MGILEHKGITVEQAAAQLGVSVQTIWRLARAGRLRRWRHLARTLFAVEDVAGIAEERATSSGRR